MRRKTPLVSDIDLSGAVWRRSIRSKPNGVRVEVAELPEGHVGVRDSEDQDGPVLVLTPGEWDAFIGGVNDGEFDS
ncbi:DUF397 domain-containing protein [Microtetraspora niveoalba]|uniref:DUF397 domain-containing protein n=1 Tax=Microtetraspora niveoalba TaxID=46175 RepID=UPI00082FD7BD|nr:DUF397 domain-containing protein [Microtetraspora niveoalba]